jgi:hypothetical protein
MPSAMRCIACTARSTVAIPEPHRLGPSAAFPRPEGIQHEHGAINPCGETV